MKRFATLLAAAAVSLAASAAPSIRTAPVARGDVAATVVAVGTLEPKGVIEIGPQVSGTLKRFAPESDYRSHVQAGQLLAELDDSFFHVRFEEEKAHLKRLTADAEAARIKADAARGDKLAAAELEAATAAVDEQKAAVDEAQLNMQSTKITTAVAGTIIDRRGQVGQAIAPNTNGPTMFLIWPEGDAMQVWAEVDETQAAQVVAKQPVAFTCAGLPGKSFKGTVGKLRLNAARVGDAVRYTAEIEVEKSDAPLLPYLTADVRIETGVHKSVLLVPNAALEWLPQSELLAAMRRQSNPQPGDASRKKTSRVWVVDNNAAKAVEVQLGATDGQKTEITGGSLKEGDAVIVEGSAP